MKKLEVIMKPFQLDDVRDEMAKISITDVIVTDIRCSYNAEKKNDSYLSDDYFVEFLPKIRVEVFVDDEKVETCAKVLKKIIEAEQARVIVYDVTEV